MTKHKKMNRWKIIGIVAFLGAGIFLVTCILGFYLLSSGDKNVEKESLFPHVVNDISIKNSTWLFVVADKSITKEDAANIINYYSKQYKYEDVFIIEIFCDYTYADQKWVWDPAYTVSNEELEAHIMYAYHRGKDEWFRSREELPENYGTACK